MRVVIVGAGFGGIGAAIELRRHGFDDITILDRAPGARRHLVPQRLPGRGLRRPEPPVLVLVRAAPPLDAAVLAARRDPRLPARRRARARRRPARRAGHRGRARATGTTARWTIESADGRTWEADALIVATGQLHRPRYPRIEARDVRRPQLPLRRVGPRLRPARQARRGDRHRRERRAVRARDRAARSSSSSSSSARATGSCRAEPPVPAAGARRSSGTCPACRRSGAGSSSGTASRLTLMIRHPRTWGRLGRARSALFMRWQLQRPRAAPQGLAGLHVRLQARAVQLALPARAAAARTSSSSPTPIDAAHADGDRHRRRPRARGRLHHLRAPASAPTDFMFPMEIVGRDGAHAARGVGGRRRTRTSGSPCPASRRCS